jgi:serine/threonine protein kinase
MEKLGEGGMGVVYKAEDTRLGRVVALKFLPSASSPDDTARFEAEAKAISALNHPNIATIHDIDEADGKRFLVLEFIQGGTLKSKLRKLRGEEKELPIDEVVKYGIQIADGLASAHHAGIIHRDVKSDNAMLTKEGNVKLADFGLAKLQNTAQLTRAGSTIGTAAYMSPEQVQGAEADPRTDIFSLGVLLYEALTGQLPFKKLR